MCENNEGTKMAQQVLPSIGIKVSVSIANPVKWLAQAAWASRIGLVTNSPAPRDASDFYSNFSISGAERWPNR
jgi:hypothetical protein